MANGDDPTITNPILQKDVDRIKEIEKSIKNAAQAQQNYNAIMSEFNDTIQEQSATLESARVQHQAGIITAEELAAAEKSVSDTIKLTTAIRNEAREAQARQLEQEKEHTKALEEANKVLAAKKALISDVAGVLGSALGPELSKVALSTSYSLHIHQYNLNLQITFC